MGQYTSHQVRSRDAEILVNATRHATSRDRCDGPEAQARPATPATELTPINRRQLLSEQATVDNYRLPHHVGSVLGTEPDDGVGYLFRLTETSGGDTRSDAV